MPRSDNQWRRIANGVIEAPSFGCGNAYFCPQLPFVTPAGDGVDNGRYRKISSKSYPYMKPSLETMPWGMVETGVIDPFGNTIRFCQRVEQPAMR